MDKSDFASSLDFERAQGMRIYRDASPVAPKLAGLCLRDRVLEQGVNSSLSGDVCELSDACTYVNDKLCGVTGFCLKATVGVDLEQA